MERELKGRRETSFVTQEKQDGLGLKVSNDSSKFPKVVYLTLFDLQSNVSSHSHQMIFLKNLAILFSLLKT